MTKSSSEVCAAAIPALSIREAAITKLLFIEVHHYFMARCRHVDLKWYVVVLAAALLACGSRQVSNLPQTPNIPAPAEQAGPVLVSHPDYIELEAGWRLRVITPLLKSGGYRLQLAGQKVIGKDVTLSVGDEVVGYETAFYIVQPAKRAGVRVQFSSAQLMREGQSANEAHPAPWRLRLPKTGRFVRLVFLRRLSAADHDMAVVATPDRNALEVLTREVQADPGNACNANNAACFWVPAGIAVRPERKTGVAGAAGAEEWVPVR